MMFVFVRGSHGHTQLAFSTVWGSACFRHLHSYTLENNETFSGFIQTYQQEGRPEKLSTIRFAAGGWLCE